MIKNNLTNIKHFFEFIYNIHITQKNQFDSFNFETIIFLISSGIKLINSKLFLIKSIYCFSNFFQIIQKFKEIKPIIIIKRDICTAINSSTKEKKILLIN